MVKETFINIDDYIAGQSAERQPVLQKVREVIKNNAPDAAEKISYQMPAFWQGENLIYFGAFKNHLGIYAGGGASARFADILKAKNIGFDKGTIRFAWDKPIDFDLIADIVKWRLTQVKKSR